MHLNRYSAQTLSAQPTWHLGANPTTSIFKYANRSSVNQNDKYKQWFLGKTLSDQHASPFIYQYLRYKAGDRRRSTVDNTEGIFLLHQRTVITVNFALKKSRQLP
jgi:hypothetical protein